MEVAVKTFEELQVGELYKLLQLRSDIFVVEQDCVFLDPDDRDQIALHVLGGEGRELVGYARIFGPGDYFEQPSIGRVAVRKAFRGRGLGIQIMQVAVNAVKERFGRVEVPLSAQKYLERFYRDLGFETEGEDYLEDGIPHVRMVLKKESEH